MDKDNNRLFHFMGPKQVLWMTEEELFKIPHPSEIPIEEGRQFRCQHFFHETWTIGTYEFNKELNRMGMTLKQVIIIKE